MLSKPSDLPLPTVRSGKQASRWSPGRGVNRTVVLVFLFVVTLILLITRVSLHISFLNTRLATPSSAPDIAKSLSSLKESRAGDDGIWKDSHPSMIGAARPRHHFQHRGVKVPPGEDIPLVAPLAQPQQDKIQSDTQGVNV